VAHAFFSYLNVQCSRFNNRSFAADAESGRADSTFETGDFITDSKEVLFIFNETSESCKQRFAREECQPTLALLRPLLEYVLGKLKTRRVEEFARVQVEREPLSVAV
jgi:hypothetical protein